MSSIYDYLKVRLDALKPIDKYQITYPQGQGYPNKPQVEEKKGGDGIVNVDTFKDCTGEICGNLEGKFYRTFNLIQAVRFEFDDAIKSIDQVTKSSSTKVSNEIEANFLLSVFDKLDGGKEVLPSNRMACVSYPEKGRDYQIHLPQAKAGLDKNKNSLKQYLLGELDTAIQARRAALETDRCRSTNWSGTDDEQKANRQNADTEIKGLEGLRKKVEAMSE